MFDRELSKWPRITRLLSQDPAVAQTEAGQRMDVGEDLITFDTPLASNTDNQVKDPSSSALNLGHLYKQCQAAREIANPVPASIYSNDNTCRFDSVNVTRIGSLDWPGEPLTLKTFHGGRIAKNNKVVNENISLSFDPRTLQCLGCSIPHKITDTPNFCLVLADQNYVPFIHDGEGHCIGVVRLENASLADLVDIGFEILDHYIPPPR
jgi:hypothetical protein